MYGSPHSVTDRRQLTWQQTFFKRVISLVNSGEESSADGVVTDLRVMQVRLITCERGVIGQRARLLIGRSAQGILLRGHPHGRGKDRSQSSGGRSGR